MSKTKSNKETIARTVKIKIDPPKEQFLSLMDMAAQVYNQHVDWCFEHKVLNINKIHKVLYFKLTNQFPTLPVALIQAIRDSAIGNIKANNTKKKWKFKPNKTATSGVTYGVRAASLRGRLLTISSLTKGNRYSTLIVLPKHFQYLLTEKINGKDKWKFKGIQLIFDKLKQQFYASLIFTAEAPSVNADGDVLGIDRGIINTISCSNGLEVSAKHRIKIKRRNSYNRSKLQAKGTRAAKRRLRRLSGREERFSQNENHIMSKSLVQLPFQYFIFEDLSGIRKKSKGRRMNRRISNWSFYQLEMYTKYKAEAVGKVVDYVDPRYTSQRCNSCGYIDRKNRNRGEFCCIKCRNTDGADQNASKNIRDKWIRNKISKEQAPVNEPNNSQNIDISSKKKYPTIKLPPRLNSMATKRLLISSQVGTSPFQASLGGGS